MNVDAFHQRLRELYLPPEGQFTLVDVPQIRFAVVDGRGHPECDECAEGVKWLYSVAHLVKPLVKERMGKHFVEPPLECLCWADKWTDFAERNKDQWKWRVMIVFVDWITQEQFEEAVGKVTLKRGPAPSTLRLMNLHEGKSVQILHVGDYDGIGAVCEKLYREYLPANRLQPNGCYHEIYLNDPARTAPAKRKIVIRQPVK